MDEAQANAPLEGIAITGMAGRFPRARDVAEFCRNIRDGVDCISHFSAQELEVTNAVTMATDPGYIMAGAIIDDLDYFDADFFGILPWEAELIDP